MEESNIRLMINKQGNICIGAMTPQGFIPSLLFESIKGLRVFAEGLMQLCDEESPPPTEIPKTFLNAFEEDTDGNGKIG